MSHPSDTAGLIEEQALVCASHPSEPWPHGDCAEGMPKYISLTPKGYHAIIDAERERADRAEARIRELEAR